MSRTIAALAAASALLVPLAAGAAPAHAGDASSGTTTIRMTVRDCAGCTVQPSLFRLDADGTSAEWQAPRQKVRNGVVTMVVPTDKTPGLSFLIDGPTREDINAAPVIVVQFKGIAPGTVVTRAQALAAKQASGCWAGTSAAFVSLTAQATVVRMQKFPIDGPGTTRVTTAWLVPSQKAPGNFDDLDGAPLATQQGAWPCNAG